MKLRHALALATAAVAAVAARRAPAPAGTAPGARTAAEAAIRDRNIAFFESRVAGDPQGARDRMQLGALYLARARASGSESDLRNAGAAARASLSLRGRRNAPARLVLAASLMAQHRFAEAREVAEVLVGMDPDRPSYRALLAEIALETGDYTVADSLFRSIPPTGDALAVGPRLARWHELHGRPGEARRHLERALQAARTRKEFPAEHETWLTVRLADLALTNGDWRSARGYLAVARDLSPDDRRVLIALARLERARGREQEALAWAERALTAAVEPSTLALLARIHRALGHAREADQFTNSFRIALSAQQDGFHRDWTLFQLDEGFETSAALLRAQADVETRRDVHGYSVLAWALYRSGRLAEASEAARRSLALGTRDASLSYRAGMIAHARGERARAAHHLNTALLINPRFDPEYAAVARRVLRNIAREDS